jgi:CRISPR-associated exonuclease Cas4
MPRITDLFDEDNLKPVSALQHLVFCERRCALIYIESVWAENEFTAEGEELHEKVHDLGESEAAGIRRVTAMPVRSLRLGLVGQCDLVEFRRQEGGEEVPYPVEYKRGSPKRGLCDEVQLCAQAMCLEEMLGCEVPRGAVFFAAVRRRKEIDFTPALRQATEAAASRLHALIGAGVTPVVPMEAKCRSCSLNDFCVAQGKAAAVESFVRELFRPAP